MKFLIQRGADIDLMVGRSDSLNMISIVDSQVDSECCRTVRLCLSFLGDQALQTNQNG